MPMFECIVVAGPPFSGKTTLAKILADQFGWKYFSVEELWRAKWKEKYPKGDESFENFMLQVTDDEEKAMDQMVGDIMKQGHVVGDMEYGFLYRDPQTLIVFTQCDIDERVKRALGLNRYPDRDFAQVKDILEQRDRDDVDRCQSLYGSDYRDSKNYDILFDTTDAAPDEALEKIMELK